MISLLRLRGFKAFNHLDLGFGALTILSGLNGAGKSSVLQSLGVIKQSYDEDCLNQKGGLLLNGEFVDLGVGRDVLCEHSDSQLVSIGIDADSHSYEWVFSYSEGDDLLQVVGDTPLLEPPPSFLSDGFQFLRADRISPAVAYPKSFNKSIRRRSLGVYGQYSPYFLAMNQDEPVSEVRIRSSDYGNTLINQVNAWLGEISPGVSISAGEIRGADLAQILFRYGGSAGILSSNEYRPTNVGFGLTYVLPIIVACLSARSGDLLLIENPEAHLHPRGQSVIGDLLSRTASDGVQVVVESHSDHVLNGVRLSVKSGVVDNSLVKLHFFGRGRDSKANVVSPEVSPEGLLSEWPDGFFDEWERALMRLI